MKVERNRGVPNPCVTIAMAQNVVRAGTIPAFEAAATSICAD